MRVHRLDDLGLGRFQLAGQDQLGQQFGDVFADHVHAEQLAVLAVEDQLDEAVGLARGQGAAAGAEGNLPILISRFCSRAFFSVCPMLATCGCV